jgi:glycosyltransferase involved in cell wall biosynthesis
MPKICLVSTYPPSADAIAPLARDLAEELAKYAEVVFLAQKGGNPGESGRQAGVKVLRCWTSALYPFQVLKLVLRKGVNMVHIQHEFFLYGQRIYSALLFLILLILLKLVRRPFVLTAHHVIPPQLVWSMDTTVGARFSLVAKMFLIPYYRTFGLASTVIVPRAEQKAALIRYYHLTASKVCVIPHALKNEHKPSRISTAEARARLAISAKHVILFFGFIRPTKGLEDLVRSLSILRSKNQDVTLLVVGMAQQRYAGYYRLIQETVLELGLSKNVVFAGYVPEERLHLYFRAADVIVFPYTKMGIESSAAFLKAAEFGRPIIATKVGEFSELKRDCAYCTLVAPSDPLRLAKAIKHAFTDRRMARSPSKAAHEFMERYSIERQAQEYVQLYLKACSSAISCMHARNSAS